MNIGPNLTAQQLAFRCPRLFMTRTPSNGPQRCDRMSSHTCAFSAKLRTHLLFLHACSSRNRSVLREELALPLYRDRGSKPPYPIHAGQFATLAP